MCQQSTAPIAIQPAANHSCGCGTHGQSARPEVGRRVPAAHEMDFPEVPFPSARVLAMAGESGLRALVRRHHALLRQSEIGHLFSADDQVFAEAVERIADFVVEACGGPAKFSENHGSGCMRTRHFPFTIDEQGREAWLAGLFRAIGDTGLPLEIREEYWAWMEPFSIRMINRRTMRAQPARIGWNEAGVRFADRGTA